MIPSYNAIRTIKQWESCRLESYQDQRGIWTIGYGHTGADVVPDLHITQDRAEYLLDQDLMVPCAGINMYTKCKLTQNQFDALTSFVFNIGIGNFKKSTMLKMLNSNDIAGAAGEFGKWNLITVNGQKVVSKGLTNRRAAERELFLTSREAV